jgi:hypothetical protein
MPSNTATSERAEARPGAWADVKAIHAEAPIVTLWRWTTIPRSALLNSVDDVVEVRAEPEMAEARPVDAPDEVDAGLVVPCAGRVVAGVQDVHATGHGLAGRKLPSYPMGEHDGRASDAQATVTLPISPAYPLPAITGLVYTGPETIRQGSGGLTAKEISAGRVAEVVFGPAQAGSVDSNGSVALVARPGNRPAFDRILDGHRVSPSLGVMPRAVASSAGVLRVDFTMHWGYPA